MRVFTYLFSLMFAGLAVVGFAYFGPPQYTQILTNNAFFRTHVVPMIDRVLAVGGGDESTVGYITHVKSQVDFRPPSALSPLQARGGERISQGTIVSSGSRSASLIRLVDDSVISLGENTTLQIELPEGNGKIASIELKVIEGTVMAQQSKTSTSKIRIKNSLGLVTEVKRMRTIVGSKSTVAKTLKTEADLNEKDLDDGARNKDIADESLEKALAEQEAEEARVKEAQVLRQKEEDERNERAREEQRRMAEEKARQQAAEIEQQALRKKEEEKARILAEKRTKAEEKIALAKRRQRRSPAGETDLAIGLAAKKVGNREDTQRYMAKSLSNQGYLATAFSDATRLATDNVMEGYLESGDCATALDFAKNVLSSYPKDQRASAWFQRWAGKLRKSRCLQ